MLSKIREKATGIFAWVIVVLISIPFALWGINSYFEGGGEAVVATVDGVDIDLNTFQNALAERRRVMAQMLQQNVDPQYFESDAFKRQVLDGLIQNAARNKFSRDEGYRVSDELLGQSIRQLPYFQTDGQFDSERYQSVINNAGLSVARFEDQQRQQLVAEQIRSGYEDSAFVSDREVDRVLSLLEQTRTADYAVLSASDPAINVEVSDAEVRSYYEENREDYFAPEQMRVEYLVLSVESIAETIEIDEGEIRRFYENNSGRFGRPASRRVSHILIAAPADADEAAEEAAREKAAELARQAREGADFAELARENSDDPGSAATGGDLGVLTPGAMVKPFEDAALALEAEGDVSDPIRSRFGYHVIKMTEYRPANVAAFEEVRAEIESELKNQLAENQYLESVERFSTLVYEQPESLEPAADELQLEIQQSDWFSQASGEGLAANPRVRNVAFSDDVRIEGLNSEAFELDANTTVSVRMMEARERRPLEFDAVADEIRANLEREARAAAVEERGRKLLGELEAGTSWDTLVEENDLNATTFEGTRDAGFDPVSRELIPELFTLEDPGESSVVPGGLTSRTGDFVIYQLTDVTDADPQNVDDARREAVRDMLRTRQSRDLFAGFEQELREQSEVTIFEEQL